MGTADKVQTINSIKNENLKDYNLKQFSVGFAVSLNVI